MRTPKLEMPLARLRDEVGRLFDRQPDFAVSDLLGGWTPAVDVLEDIDKVTVKAELPGFRREDIHVSLHEGNLLISGERRSEEEQRDGEFYRCERYYGKFHRSISLPTSVNMTGIGAIYRDGILTITLPKSEQAKPKQIDISVG